MRKPMYSDNEGRGFPFPKTNEWELVILKTTFTQVWVMVDNKVIGQAADIAEVSEVLTDYMNGFVPEGEDFDFSKVMLVNAVDHMQLHSDWMTHAPGEVKTDGWEENDETESRFTINAGKYRGESFDYEEDVIDFLMDKIKEGSITADEASETEILKEPVISGGISFDQALGEWKIDWDKLPAGAHEQLLLYGMQYVAAQDVPKEEVGTIVAVTELYTEEEVEKLVNAKVDALLAKYNLQPFAEIEDMTDEAIQVEAIKLMNRAAQLMAENKRRAEAKEELKNF